MGKCCFQITRTLVIIFNFLFMLIGCAILGIAIFVYANQTFKAFKDDMEDKSAFVDIILFSAIGVGGVTIIVSTFGMCGAYHESECLLGTYFFCLLLLVAAEVAAGVSGFVLMKDDELKTVFADAFQPSIKNYMKSTDTELPFFVRNLQTWLDCCGGYGSVDYLKAGVLDQGKKLEKLRSVCKTGTDESGGILGKIASEITDAFNSIKNLDNGCGKKMVQLKPYMLIALLAIAGVEVLAMMAAMSLCCFVRRLESGYVGVST